MQAGNARATIQEATAAYETWLAEYTQLVPTDMAEKHARMAADRFAFFRATYYRWAQHWAQSSADVSSAPAVLAVGDLHIENFGTWRDSEGRLVWGVNDFDEAFTVPYTNDLVRLATSALLAIESDHLGLRPRPACAALLAGYRAGLVEAGGRPFVLAEEHPWLRRVATRRLRDAARFWKRLDLAGTPSSEPPPEARMVLDLALPERDLPYRVHPRVAGEGSLGHPRWVAITSWRGARIAREAKARAPSASFWCAADGAPQSSDDPYAAIVAQAVRAHDPFLRIGDRWLVRRLAPDCSRVELGSLPDRRDEAALLGAMGRETANIHLGTPEMVPAVVADLEQRSADWLFQASRVMLRGVTRDWKAYRAT